MPRATRPCLPAGLLLGFLALDGLADAARPRHRPSACDRPRSRPVTCSVCTSSSVPAWDTRPFASADTAILGQRAILRMRKVPLARDGQDLRQAQSSQLKGTISFQQITLN